MCERETMIYSIYSPSLHVSVSEAGAELQSIRLAQTGTEFLWQGNPAWWASRAPILFPFIGASKDGQYSYDGKFLSAPRHGFARGASFRKAYADNGKISLEYGDNESTRGFYPFAFTLTVSFSFEGEHGETLCVLNRVENKGANAMPFCLGAHEAYNCAPFEDCYLEFLPEDTTENLNQLLSETVALASGLLSGERYAVPLNNNTLPLKYSLFDHDTLVFKKIPFGKVALKNKTNADVIEVAYDAPNLAIWTKPGAPYVCIEPWFGLPGYENGTPELSSRPGAVLLPPGETFTSKHFITARETTAPAR